MQSTDTFNTEKQEKRSERTSDHIIKTTNLISILQGDNASLLT